MSLHAPPPPAKSTLTAGFTLIELSVVLVIIGLIVGGVMLGQSLVNAAGVRATISQIEKYNTAVNTFHEKYQCLPGDCPNAGNFGFVARGQYAGEGDGNGVIEGNANNGSGSNCGYCEGLGETVVFWRDLSTAGLIEGGFATASESGCPIGATFSGTSLNLYFPQAKLGGGNYISVWSGGVALNGGYSPYNGQNYFELDIINAVNSGYYVSSSAGLTVAQAFSIDTKIDDGLPQSGNVTAVILGYNAVWVAGGGGYGASTGFQGEGNPTTGATPASASTCYANGNATGTQQYSVTSAGSANLNCALSFVMQGAGNASR